METDRDVVIVGAGPYGLSIAAHLAAAGVDFKIFGQPMQTWRTAMPKGMLLKSEGFASSLSDPEDAFTFGAYCAEHHLQYADIGLPVPLDEFISYGLEFQERFVPDLDQRSVRSISAAENGYTLRLEDDSELTAAHVVLALGISRYAYVPPILASLPGEVMTHSSVHVDLEGFAGQDVAVVGGGSSAVDLAALLLRVDAHPVIVARRTQIEFHDPPQLPRPLLTRIRRPQSCIGQDWRRRIFTDLPLLFHALPEAVRLREIRIKMGPAAGWFSKDEVVGRLPFKLGREVASASVDNGRVQLQLLGRDGSTEELTVDKVIAATGYQVDVNRLEVLEPTLRSRLKTVDDAHALNTNFESSLPGMYFVGVAAMNSFGPVFRFACGDKYTATHLARHLSRVVSGRVSSDAVTTSG